MEQAAPKNFILIDDDQINNMVGSKVIRNVIPKAHIQAFTDPQKGVRYVESAFTEQGTGDAVLFLDINMPGLTGWDVLDLFNSFDDAFKQRVKIYMLSSSVNTPDKEKAARNKLVSGYIMKPLSGLALYNILPGLA